MANSIVVRAVKDLQSLTVKKILIQNSTFHHGDASIQFGNRSLNYQICLVQLNSILLKYSLVELRLPGSGS